MTVYGRHDDNDSSVVSFLHPTLHSEDFAHLLDARGVAVRTGHHCAQPLLNRLGISGTFVHRSTFTTPWKMLKNFDPPSGYFGAIRMTILCNSPS